MLMNPGHFADTYVAMTSKTIMPSIAVANTYFAAEMMTDLKLLFVFLFCMVSSLKMLLDLSDKHHILPVESNEHASGIIRNNYLKNMH